MTNIKVLNNVDHKDIKINTSTIRENSLNVNRSMVYVTEIADLHKEFPLVLYKDPQSENLQLHAILGLEKNENLFINDNGWTSRFVPSLLARGPFSLGYASQSDMPTAASINTSKDPVICVDLDDLSVNVENGEAIFLPFGGEAPYLSYVKRALQSIQTGMQYNQTLFAMIQKFDLLEPVAVNIQLSNVEEVNFSDYFTINQEKLSLLDAQALETLSKAGVLSLLYFMLSSLGNFQHLIDLKSKLTGMSAHSAA